MNVNVLLSGERFGSSHIAGKEFFGGLGPLLLDFLRVESFFVSLEKLIGVSTSGNNHGSVGGATENALVESNVLGLVLVGLSSTVGVLVFVLGVDDTGLRTVKALALLLFHHLS